MVWLEDSTAGMQGCGWEDFVALRWWRLLIGQGRHSPHDAITGAIGSQVSTANTLDSL